MSATVQPGRNLDEGVMELTRGLSKHTGMKAVLEQTARKATKARSCYYKAINASIDLSPKERWDAHELVNSEYNRVVAHSLQAIPNLVASSSHVGNLLQKHGDDPYTVQRQVAPAPEYAKQLEGLTWTTLAELLDYLVPVENESPEELADRARYIDGHISFAAKEVEDFEGKPIVKFVLKEAVAEAVSDVASQARAVVATAGAAALTHSAWSFLLAPALLIASKPMAAAIFKHLFGHQPSIAGLTKEYLAKVSLDRHTGEIIDIVKRHPGYPRLPEA